MGRFIFTPISHKKIELTHTSISISHKKIPLSFDLKSASRNVKIKIYTLENQLRQISVLVIPQFYASFIISCLQKFQSYFIEFFKELFKSFVDQGDVPNESCLGIKFLVNWGYVPKEEEL